MATCYVLGLQLPEPETELKDVEANDQFSSGTCVCSINLSGF